MLEGCRLSLTRRTAISCLLMILLTAKVEAKGRTHAAGPSTDTGLAICSRVQDTVNGLADFTYTRCFPALANGYGFVIVSERPVFSAPAAKKAWLLTVVAAVGKEMNDRRLSGGEMLLSDVAHTREKTAWSVSVELARTLQRRIKHDEITLDEMYAAVLKQMRKVTYTSPAR